MYLDNKTAIVLIIRLICGEVVGVRQFLFRNISGNNPLAYLVVGAGAFVPELNVGGTKVSRSDFIGTERRQIR